MKLSIEREYGVWAQNWIVLVGRKIERLGMRRRRDDWIGLGYPQFGDSNTFTESSGWP